MIDVSVFEVLGGRARTVAPLDRGDGRRSRNPRRIPEKIGWSEPGDYDVNVIAIKLEPGAKEGAAETRHELFIKSNDAVHVAPHSSVVLELSR